MRETGPKLAFPWVMLRRLATTAAVLLAMFAATGCDEQASDSEAAAYSDGDQRATENGAFTV